MQFIWGLESCFYSYVLVWSLSFHTSLYVCVCARTHMHAHLCRCVRLHLRREEEGIGCPPLSFSAQYLWQRVSPWLSLYLCFCFLRLETSKSHQSSLPPPLSRLKLSASTRAWLLTPELGSELQSSWLYIELWPAELFLQSTTDQAFMVPGQISCSASRLI